MTTAESTALLLIDVQNDMLRPPSPVPAAAEVEHVLADLLARARRAGAEIVHVQNDGDPGEPDEPGTDGWQLVFEPGPDELVVRKDQQDVFAADGSVAGTLHERGVSSVVIAGLQSDYCVAASARGALAAGFPVSLVIDAHATYGQDADSVARRIERELAGDGVGLVGSAAVDFTG